MLRNPTVRMHECNACGTRVPYGHGRSARGDGAAFDQRGYHALVVEHSRARFLRAEYLGAVAGAYGALEGMIRAKSGVDGHGPHMINRALGEDGALEVGLPGLAGATRASMRRGLAQMCVGAVSGMRNPIAHDASLRIGRGEALDMLGVLSYLCGQVEQTRRRAGQGRPSPAGRDARARTFRPKAGPAGGGRPGQARGAHGDRAREAGLFTPGAATRGAVCASGHALEQAVPEGGEFVGKCPECDADVITECPHCGLYFEAGTGTADVGPACRRCGGPFPWSVEARRAGRRRLSKAHGTIATTVVIIAGVLAIITFFR